VVCLGDRVSVPGLVVLGLCVEFLLESGQGGGDAAGVRLVFEGVYCEPCEVVLEGGFGEAVFGGLGSVAFGGVGEDAAQVQQVVAKVRLGRPVHGVGVAFFPVSFLVESFLGVVVRCVSFTWLCRTQFLVPPVWYWAPHEYNSIILCTKHNILCFAFLGAVGSAIGG